MSYCPELFHKFKRYSEACGLGDAKDIQNHIDLCAEISKSYDVEEDRVYLLFSKTASKALYKFPKTSKIRKNAIDRIVEYIKDNKRVTKKHVDFWIHSEGAPFKTETVPITKVAKKVMIDPGFIPAAANGGLSAKINLLKSALTSGQIGVLQDAMRIYHQDDELAALSMVLKEWAENNADKRKAQE